jgi:hypothetical protein
MDDEVLSEYFIAVTERFKLRWLRQKIDFSDLEAEDIKNEVNQMLELLNHGLCGKQI